MSIDETEFDDGGDPEEFIGFFFVSDAAVDRVFNASFDGPFLEPTVDPWSEGRTPVWRWKSWIGHRLAYITLAKVQGLTREAAAERFPAPPKVEHLGERLAAEHRRIKEAVLDEIYGPIEPESDQ